MAHKKVWLIRHGRTPGNEQKKYMGRRTDEPLSEEGVRMARAAGRLAQQIRSSAVGTLRVCASPMKRAVQTAQILFEHPQAGQKDRMQAGQNDCLQTGEAGNLPVGQIEEAYMSIEQIEDLAEIDFGIFEGKTNEELSGEPSYQAWVDSAGRTPIPGGERMDAFIRRCYRGLLSALGDPGREETVAIVCHGGTIMAIMYALTGKDYYTFMTDNLGGYRLEMEMDAEETKQSVASFGEKDLLRLTSYECYDVMQHEV